MGILKNGGGSGEGKGRKGRGFQQPAPKVSASIQQPPPEPKERFNNLGLHVEYFLLPPPRSLMQLAVAKGVTTVPIEWYQRYESEGWAIAAAAIDEAHGEARVGRNWQSLERTQREALELCDDLIKDVKRLRRSAESVADIKDLANTLKTLTGVRLQVLEGLQKPESVSATDVASLIAISPEKNDRRAIGMTVWEAMGQMDPYEYRKLNEPDVIYSPNGTADDENEWEN